MYPKKCSVKLETIILDCLSSETPQMVKMLVPSLWGDLRTVTSTMVKYRVAAKEVFGLIMDLVQGTAKSRVDSFKKV